MCLDDCLGRGLSGRPGSTLIGITFTTGSFLPSESDDFLEPTSADFSEEDFLDAG